MKPYAYAFSPPARVVLMPLGRADAEPLHCMIHGAVLTPLGLQILVACDDAPKCHFMLTGNGDNTWSFPFGDRVSLMPHNTAHDIN